MLMINQSFIQLIENYKKNNKDVDLVRKYLLSNVYELDNLNEYIAYFEKNASSINDSLGIAIAKMAYFWDLYMTDLELAHKYNQEALEIYKSMPNYEDLPGYLSVLNNELIYDNYTCRLSDGHKILCEARPICKKQNNINYYTSFSLNSVYILCDIGLYDKAREVLNELRVHSYLLSESNLGVIDNLETKIYIYEGKYDLALDKALAHIEWNNKKQVFPNTMSYRNLMAVYIAMNDKEKAHECYIKLLQYLKEENYVVNEEVYLEIARYFKLIGNKEQAYEYYLKCFKSYSSVLGHKTALLSEALDSFKEMNDDANYLLALKDLNDILKQSNFILKDIASEKHSGNDDIFSMRYKYVFLKLEELTHFINELNLVESIDDLYDLFSNRVKKMLNSISSKLTLIGFNDKLIEKVNSLEPISVIDDKIFILKVDDILDNYKNICDILVVVKICNKNNDFLGYWIIETEKKSENEKLEFYYILKLLNEILGSSIKHIIDYNNIYCKYNRDQLTNCYNRYGLDDIVSHHFSISNTPLYYIMIDIDNFKAINDKYGHQSGDKVLISLVNILEKYFGENVFRIGGEEFVALAEDSLKLEETLNSLLTSISSDRVKYENNLISYTVSIGVSKINDKHIRHASLEADNKLYLSKKNGKNQYNI